MGHQSAYDPDFQRTAEECIKQNGEILVMIRFAYQAGNKSYEFFHSAEEFRTRLAQLEPRTSIVVFKNGQLPLRGVVDLKFIEAAMTLVSDGEEYLVVGLDPVHYGKASWLPFWTGTFHQDQQGMRENLDEAMGMRVVFGVHPQWERDDECTISGIIPEADGRVICGRY